MENRYLLLNRQLSELDRLRTKSSRDGISAPFGESPFAPGGWGSYTRAQSVGDRALVVLIENGGIDLDVGAWIDLLPGSSLIPSSTKSALASAIRQGIKRLSDDILESAELLINGYARTKGELYGDVTVLRNGTALYASLRDTLVHFTKANKVIDLLVLTHGSHESIAVHGGVSVTAHDIRAIRGANGGNPIRLRSVYMMNCVGASLNAAWIDIGAKASAGTVRNNYLPEPTTYFFFDAWKRGQPFGEAVSGAYRKTIETMNTVVREAVNRVLPSPVAGLIVEKLVDFPSREFVRDSAPVLAGDTQVTIQTDGLSFTQSVSALSYALVPLAAGMDVKPRSKSWAMSSKAVDLIKSFEGFRSKLYDDPAGHCTIGYGTLVHRGPCNGDASEAPYARGIDEARATELLASHANEAASVVNDLVKTELAQHQFDALVSFVYNVGQGNFGKSTLLKKLNEGDYDAVPVEMRKWVNGGGKKLPGLVRRREAEVTMFTTGLLSTGQSEWLRGFDTDDGEHENDEGEVDEEALVHQQSVTAPDFCPVREADDASTEHFALREFRSKDGVDVPRPLRGNVQLLMAQLEVLRAEVGAPITITSGYRSPEHNKKVGGAKKSQHLCGIAADIKVKGMTPKEVHAKIEELIAAGRMKQGGLGLYKTFVHYDIRGKKARW
ncbi:glycoside hydrolase family protein [Sandaracinus amylolyticus]|uniref:glycoside hydrolase family protein n=1 Tax=Sandaracinus amylolyticus TaxID=927083 RepID=UPI001F2D85D0|nr:D-Ala-D-Ala carboxypeptidase family metallohydrolase [Sandaracinus amylolyticus]UJR82738.1 Hypothetical protein I5071_48030 [Sandaracinus amylolyticus]